MPLVSFVLPVYNESEGIEVFHAELSRTLDLAERELSFELIYVNDGSRDDSLARLHRIAADDPRVVVVDFSRNFGHQIAVTAGIDNARGDAAVIMDTDLQDPPAVAMQLIERWQQGDDVVYAQRRSRRDSFFKRTTASAFYWTLELLADTAIPRNTGDFRLIDRKVIDALKRFPERNRFVRGLVSYVGFTQSALLFDRDARFAGETGYPLRKMLRFAADGILGFSTFPLKLIRLIGTAVVALSAVGILIILINRIWFPQELVPGWAFTVIAILFVGGIQISMLSVVGSYLGRVYAEVQARPLYLIRSIARDAGPATPAPAAEEQIHGRADRSI